MKTSITIDTETKLRDVSVRIIDELITPRSGAAVVLALSGDIGAGKTSLVRELARAIAPAVWVTSPTYVLMKRYNVTELPHYHELIHIDAYRLAGADELGAIGWGDVVRAGAIVCIEWPERIAEALPKDAIPIHLSYIGETSRKIQW